MLAFAMFMSVGGAVMVMSSAYVMWSVVQSQVVVGCLRCRC